MAESVQGTWGIGGFKLPDFGATELFNVTTGGNTSNPIWNNPAVYQATYGSPQPTPDQIKSTSIIGGYSPSLTPNTIERQTVLNEVNPGNGGNGGNGGGGGNPAGNQDVVHPGADYGYGELINRSYNSRMNDLAQQEGTLRQNQGSILSDIGGQYDVSRGTLGSNLKQSQTQLDYAGQQGSQRQQDALTAARRLYNDLIMGGQQRFGGASSAGEAYQALTGRELQRNNAQITQDYNTYMGQVSMARQGVQAKYDDAMSQLEQQKNAAINQANRDFNDKLSQINSYRNQAASDKAAQQLNALNKMRDQIYNINVAVAKNSGALNTYKSQAETQLKQMEDSINQSYQAAQGGLNTFSQQTTTNPQTALSFQGAPMAQAYSPTGAIYQPTRKDQYPFA